MTIEISKESRALVQRWVDEGRFSTAAEALERGLQLLKDEETLRRSKLAELRQQVAEGIADADAGRVVDGDEGMQRIRENLRHRARKSA